jgi:hypothetical protein
MEHKQYLRNQQNQVAWRDWVTGENFEYFVTLNFNNREIVKHNYAQKTLWAWAARVDKALVGRNFSKLDVSLRTQYFAAAEHTKGNYHYHLKLQLPKMHNAVDIKQVMDDAWKKVCGAGSTWIEHVDGAYEGQTAFEWQQRTSGYIAKALWEDTLGERTQVFIEEKTNKI